MVDYLFDHWEEIKQDISRCYLVLFLDYDGTLTPIASRPELAKMSSEVRNTLREISRLDQVKVVIISGRSLKNLQRFIRIPGIIYVGNHGFEIYGPKMCHVHPSAESSRKLLRRISGRLEKALQSIPGIIVENKVYTLSIHYREVAPDEVDFAKVLLLRQIGQYLSKSLIVMTEGKKVWEVRPGIEWGKGKTVLWLFARTLVKTSARVLPIYIGDDFTDEDAFKVLKHKGLGIKVVSDAKQTTDANYFLKSPSEVLEFLKRIRQAKIISKYGAG